MGKVAALWSAEGLSALACIGFVASGVACDGGMEPSRDTDGGSTNDGPVAIPTLKACDPLAPDPVTLGRILGIGKDASATLYLADERPNHQNRVFVSQGDTLQRMLVRGAGTAGQGADVDYDFSFQSLDGTLSRALLIQRRADAATAMELAPFGSRDFITDAATGNERLALVDATSIADWKLANLPRAIYGVFDIENGTEVVLTADLNDWVDGVRVFYGPPEDLVQRTLVQFGQTHGSSTVVIDFLVDGTPASLLVLASIDDSPDFVTFQLGDAATLSATHRFPPPSTLPDLSFRCIVAM